MLCGCLCDYRIGCACCVDVCGTTALVVHIMWMYVGLLHWLCMHAMWAHVLLLHWLYMLCVLMWDNCIGFACYVDVCGATAHVVCAMWMHMGTTALVVCDVGVHWQLSEKVLRKVLVNVWKYNCNNNCYHMTVFQCLN
jgi:hypothetical protein